MSAAPMHYQRDRSPSGDGMLYRAPEIVLSAKEERAYNLASALLDIADERTKRSGLAWDISDELARATPDGMYRGGLIVPHSITTSMYGTRAGLDSATATKGAELKFNEPGPFIEALRKKAVVLRLGATELEGLRGDVKLPRSSAPGTAAFISAQNPGSDVSDTNLLLDQASLTPKTIMSTTSFSRQLLIQAQVSTGVDKLVRYDLAEDHAVGIDFAAIQGSGTSGNPTGIINTSGVGSVAGGTNGAQSTWANITGLELAVSLANADTDPAQMAYLTTPTIRNSWRNKDRAGGATGWFIMSDGQVVNQYPVGVSNNVPSTLTKGTASGTCHAIIFGRFSELLMGFWGALDIVADPYRLKKQGMIEMTSFEMLDIAVRHPVSFCCMLDALP